MTGARPRKRTLQDREYVCLECGDTHSSLDDLADCADEHVPDLVNREVKTIITNRT